MKQYLQFETYLYCFTLMILGAAFVLLLTAAQDIRERELIEDPILPPEWLIILIALAIGLIIYLSFEIFQHMSWKEGKV